MTSVTWVEIERKRRVEDHEAVRRRLFDRGFATPGPVTEVDTYYSRPDVDFLETVECLRVRRRGERAEVTYKPPSVAATHTADGVVAKTETNVALSGADQADQANRLLEALGMVLLVRVEKVRASYRHAEDLELTVTLDEVDGLGVFAETEIVSERPRAEVVERVRAAERRLGLDSCPVVELPYRDLVLGASPRVVGAPGPHGGADRRESGELFGLR